MSDFSEVSNKKPEVFLMTRAEWIALCSTHTHPQQPGRGLKQTAIFIRGEDGEAIRLTEWGGAGAGHSIASVAVPWLRRLLDQAREEGRDDFAIGADPLNGDSDRSE